MSASFYELLKFAKTGIPSHDMSQFDKLKARQMVGGQQGEKTKCSLYVGTDSNYYDGSNGKTYVKLIHV